MSDLQRDTHALLAQASTANRPGLLAWAAGLDLARDCIGLVRHWDGDRLIGDTSASVCADYALLVDGRDIVLRHRRRPVARITVTAVERLVRESALPPALVAEARAATREAGEIEAGDPSVRAWPLPPEPAAVRAYWPTFAAGRRRLDAAADAIWAHVRPVEVAEQGDLLALAGGGR